MKYSDVKTLTIVLLVISLWSCADKKYSHRWHVVLKTDKNGEVLAGSKDQLINAVRRGHDLKIGWGGKGKTVTIEHLCEPIWLAILNGQEVMAHLDPQVLSTIDWDSLNVSYKEPKKLRQEWRVVLTTKGTFDAVWYDRKADTVIARRPQRHVMTWFVRGSSNKKAVPFFETQSFK